MSAETSANDRNKAAYDALRDVDDPVTLACVARIACARIATNASNDGPRATGADQLHLLTELVHTIRMLRDAAECTTGRSDDMVADLSWRYAGAIGRRLTDEPLPILRGQALN